MDLISQGKVEKGNFNGFIIFLITIGIAFFASLMGGLTIIALQAIDFLGSAPMIQGVVLALIVPFVFIAGCFTLYIRLVEKRKFVTVGFIAKNKFKKYGIGFGIGIGMIGFQVIAITLLGGMTFRFEFDGTVFLTLIAMLIGFIIQGGTEEFMTRGFLVQAIGRKHGRVWAVIVSTIVFVILHGLNPGVTILGFINLALFAVFACLYALKEGDILGICGLHSAWNWFMGPFMGIFVSGIHMPGKTAGTVTYTSDNSLLTGGDFGLEGGLLCTIVFVVGSIVLMVMMKNQFGEAEIEVEA